MSTIAIILVILSALLHAGWNLIGKSSQGSGFSFFFVCSVVPAILLTPYLYWFINQIEIVIITTKFWWLLAVSGVFQVIYLYGLSIAYQKADIGVVYPIARAFPVLLVGLGSVALGQEIAIEMWFGFVFITCGCFLTPITRLREIQIKSYLNNSLFWAFIAALGTTGYSIIDNIALRELSKDISQTHSMLHIAIFYLGAQFWAIVLWLSLWFFLSGRQYEFVQAWRFKKQGALAGVMMASTYGLVLFAMTMTENVSYVVALRQISIVFGLLMGGIFLREKLYLIRGIGIVTILIGLVISIL